MEQGRQGRTSGFRYQPPLDGVRALAVLAVVCFHYGFRFGVGGYLGVDIFLVLSGFLITSLLAIERSTSGRIDFLHFWGRRIRRLLPALLVLLVAVSVHTLLVAEHGQLARIRSDGLATLFYVQNWHLAWAGPKPSPLSHTWSLAIEEQWYLIWPPVFLGLTWLCRGRARLLIGIVLAMALASALEMAALGFTGRAYWGTDSRAQSLLLGAALALLLRITPGPVRRGSRVALEVAGLVGLAVLVVVVTSPPTWMYQGGFFLVAFAASCVIAASVQGESRVLRPMLSLAPLRWLGLISYGVYLYHFPILRWVNPQSTGLSVVPLSLLRFTITVLVAWLSYRCIELPVRQGRLVPRRVQLALMPVAIAATAVLLVVTTVGATAVRPLSRADLLWVYARNTTPAGAQRVLLVGDGEVSELATVMAGPYDAPGMRGLGLGSSTCRLEDLRPSAGGPCRHWWKQTAEAIQVYKPQTVVVLFDAGDPTGSAVATSARLRLLRAALAEMETAVVPTESRVALLTPACARSGAADGGTAGERSRLTRILRSDAERAPARVSLLDYGDAVCAGEGRRAVLDGTELRSPTGALTPGGARAIWGWIAARIARTGGAASPGA